MKAILLAAGRGRRLDGHTGNKCLLDVGGATLLERMFDNLSGLVAEVVLVTGYQSEALTGAAEQLASQRPFDLKLVYNPDFLRGSLVSLWSARAAFGEAPILIMDADVLCPRLFLDRLVNSPHPSCFLLDASRSWSGEEMMLLGRSGRVLRIQRGVDPQPGDVAGEGVGFLKVAPEHQPALLDALRPFMEAGDLDREYEAAVDQFLDVAPVGYEPVSGLPWIEIDFPQDVQAAREQILPALQALESRAAG